MNTQNGSYQYDCLEEKPQIQELERLYRQASNLLETERQLWQGIGIRAGCTLLDIGCGSGVVTQELAEKVYPAQAVGIDVSPKLLEEGRQAYSQQSHHNSNPQTQKNLKFQQGSVYQLPFSDNSFDIVYARLLFQHLTNPLEALQSIWRVVKPGGSVCIIDVDKDWSSLYPAPETSSLLDKAIVEKQLRQGGDPWVGRKLGYYMRSTGFLEVTTSVNLIDSDQLGLAKFFDMLSFGSSYQSEQNEFARLKEQAQLEIGKLLNDPYAWAGFGLFVVTGKKESLV